ncbi:unnamed protein product, partial [Heterosigma akashiwo]
AGPRCCSSSPPPAGWCDLHRLGLPPHLLHAGVPARHDLLQRAEHGGRGRGRRALLGAGRPAGRQAVQAARGPPGAGARAGHAAGPGPHHGALRRGRVPPRDGRAGGHLPAGRGVDGAGHGRAAARGAPAHARRGRQPAALRQHAHRQPGAAPAGAGR